jgi:putative transposase
MARKPRLTLADHPHLVALLANSGRAAICDLDDAALFLEALRHAATEARVAAHAYRVEPARALLLLTPQAAGEGLGRFVQRLGRVYGRRHNDRHALRGSPWEGRFRSCLVEPGATMLRVMAALECPPDAHAGGPCVNSAAHHLGALRQAWLSDPPEYWHLGNTPFEREQRWASMLAGLAGGAQLALRIDAALRSGLPLGGEDFAARISLLTGRRTVPGRPGRPRRIPTAGTS